MSWSKNKVQTHLPIGRHADIGTAVYHNACLLAHPEVNGYKEENPISILEAIEEDYTCAICERKLVKDDSWYRSHRHLLTRTNRTLK